MREYFFMFLIFIPIAAGDCMFCHSDIDSYMLEEQTTCNDCHQITTHREVCTNCHVIADTITYHQLHNATCSTCHIDAKKSQVVYSACTTCHINIHVTSNVTSITQPIISKQTYERFTLYSLFQKLWSLL